ncbi:UNVERIFIED_CONTAM: hypothetical protein Sradi_2072000 [Sesamum radiatum]|uniref:Uncharacterized protein n=1 Tax=Sesamum radiatum TaxID=300843 RepID=A0AAW2THY1_SESRA
MSFIGAGLFDQLLDVKSLLASDIQRYKAEREREQRDRDGLARPPPPASRKDSERHRSPPSFAAS